MSEKIKMYLWVIGCFVGFSLPNGMSEGVIKDTLYILGLACLIGAIAQFKRMRKSKQ